MQRVNFYVDGYNLYFGLRAKKWKRYYWLDLPCFCTYFLRPHQTLERVFYFTAIPHNKDKRDRFDEFLSANRLNPLFSLVLGKYLTKTIRYGKLEIPTFEEKQTDVNIAIALIRDVIMDKCDCSVLVSADSDLSPVIDFIREVKPSHKVIVYFPPNRFSFDLQQRANSTLKLQNYEVVFKSSQLPESIQLDNGYTLRRPARWK